MASSSRQEMTEMLPEDEPRTLPFEVLLKISKELHASSVLNLYHTATFFSSVVPQPVYRQALSLLEQLLNHADLGDWDFAERIWKAYPSLLTCRGTVYHPNPTAITPDINPGRYKYVNHTAWQIALMNEEYEIAEEMGQFMDDEEKRKQFAEIFPDGEIAKHNWDLQEAKRLLNAVFDALLQDKSISYNVLDVLDVLDVMNDATRVALNALYLYVKPAPEHKTGLVFDTNFYVEARQLYEDRSSQFEIWEQHSFWTIRVEEHLAALLGTGYLRAHAQGIGNALEKKGCILADGSSYFPCRRSPNSVPGLHFLVGYYGGSVDRAERWARVRGTGRLRILCQAKHEQGRTYAAIFACKDIVMSNFVR